MFKMNSQCLWMVVSVLAFMDAFYLPIGTYGPPHGKTLPPNPLSQNTWQTLDLLPSSEDRSDAVLGSKEDLQNLKGILNETGDNEGLNNAFLFLEASKNILSTNLINASLLEETLSYDEPETFAESQTLTKAMSMIHDIVMFDNELNMDLFLNKFCSIAAKDIMDKMPFGGIFRVVAQITVYEAEGCELLAQHYAKILVRELGVRQRDIKQILHKSCPNDLSDSMKCENRISELLHTIPSLGHLYSVVGAAVYGAEHLDLTQAKVNEVLHEFSQSDIAQFDTESSFSRHKRGGCVSAGEAKAQSVITWIPFIGALYNLVSSAVYAGKGCKDTAENRAINGASSLFMHAFSMG